MPDPVDNVAIVSDFMALPSGANTDKETVLRARNRESWELQEHVSCGLTSSLIALSLSEHTGGEDDSSFTVSALRCQYTSVNVLPTCAY